MEYIYGIIGTIVAIASAYFAGKFIGTSKAKSDASASRATEDANRISESASKAAGAQVEASKNASDIRNEISSLDDGDALKQLRRDYARDKDGN